MNYCNCLPSYNYTQDGNNFTVNNGSCIRTSAAELPWCFVIEDTCITPVLHRAGLGKNDSAWDTCLTTSEALSPFHRTVLFNPQISPSCQADQCKCSQQGKWRLGAPPCCAVSSIPLLWVSEMRAFKLAA